MDKIITKPGKGWVYLGSSVWEHESGTRIHLNGLVRLPDKQSFFSLYDSRVNSFGHYCIEVNGGNKRRGLMTWAVNLINTINIH